MEPMIYCGDRLEALRALPSGAVRLVLASPPYNMGKAYEKRESLATWTAKQRETLIECVRVLAEDGSLCWQVGNHVVGGGITPLDMLIYPICTDLGLTLRNRIVWTYGHGLHCTKRFSGRYETILWFTKSDKYVFNLDPVRVPQKYPGKKYFKGPRAGELSCNPLGKNPGDVWDIPNVKNNHPEKTKHPCQFPIELAERLVLSLTNPGDLVIDPYMGVGSTLCAALLHGRRGGGSDTSQEYCDIAQERGQAAVEGSLSYRRMGTAIHTPNLV